MLVHRVEGLCSGLCRRAWRRYTGQCRGFTLVECLVVFAVIGILLSLLLPAVQSAREAARRNQCQCNLKQFGLALQEYASVYGVMPSGLGGEKHYSLHVALLPYYEQAPLYNAFNMSVFAADVSSPGPNSTAVYARLGILTCPSDPYSVSPMTNYAGNLGDNRAAYKPNGVFEGPPVGFQQITDGASMTAAMSEFLVGRPERVERLRSVFWPADFATGPPLDLRQFSTRCFNLTGMIPAQNIKGRLWTLGLREFTLYDHTLPINQPTCTSTVHSTEVAGSTTATSLHPGGADCLFADGHVRFLSQEIDPSVWRALGTRNGGEVISHPPF
ncbi:MAG: DUF1559 domain-containing protein [Isosphaeraceae bacterium]